MKQKKAQQVTVSRRHYENLLSIREAMKDFDSWTKAVDARERRKQRAWSAIIG